MKPYAAYDLDTQTAWHDTHKSPGKPHLYSAPEVTTAPCFPAARPGTHISRSSHPPQGSLKLMARERSRAPRPTTPNNEERSWEDMGAS